MKIEIQSDSIKPQVLRLIPENDKDCFDLGVLSKHINYTLILTNLIDCPKLKIEWLELPVNELLKILLEEKKKGGE